MKNRTIYDVLNEAMEDYSYSIRKEKNMVEIKGSVVVPRIEIEVTHEKIFYYASEDRELLGDGGNAKLAKVIVAFKEELKDKVASVIKEHKEELTDDEAMIEKLQYEIKTLKEMLGETEEALKEAREKITRLELERIGTQPYQPYPVPWSTGTTPWSPWITWDTPYIGDPPGWLDKNNITCENNDECAYNSSISTLDGIERNGGSFNYTSRTTDDILTDARIKYNVKRQKRKNGGER